jgi:hypothetical protein
MNTSATLSSNKSLNELDALQGKGNQLTGGQPYGRNAGKEALREPFVWNYFLPKNTAKLMTIQDSPGLSDLRTLMDLTWRHFPPQGIRRKMRQHPAL